MSEKFNVLQSAMASSERIFKLLDEPVAIALAGGARPPPASRPGHIVFEHVWFAYKDKGQGHPAKTTPTACCAT